MNKKPLNVSSRELHLIDIENETGKPNPTAPEIAKFRVFYCERNNVPRDAHVVIAASSGATLLEAAFGWPGARTTFLPGRDGADMALIEVALDENVDKRYGKVVIASGDHIFAEAATTLIRLGVQVTVFARAVVLSRFLRETAATIRVFSAEDFSLAS